MAVRQIIRKAGLQKETQVTNIAFKCVRKFNSVKPHIRQKRGRLCAASLNELNGSNKKQAPTKRNFRTNYKTRHEQKNDN